MSLNNLVKTTTKQKRRLGLGHGSGRSKTAGRGTKGQNARQRVPYTKTFYSGGSLAFVKSLPFLRGKVKNFSFNLKPIVLSISDLTVFKKGDTVDVKSLISSSLVKEKEVNKKGVKILGDGDLNIALTVKVPVSKSAKTKIEKAGGTVE